MLMIICSPFLITKIAGAEDIISLKYKVEAFYTMGPSDSKALAHKLALFRAKRKAADKAAHDFAQRKLIQFENGDRNELVALVAENLTYLLLFDKWKSNEERRTYVVAIESEVKLSDFINAQLNILKMREKMVTDDFRKEMEPAEPELIKPGYALAKAYWLIRIGELRMAIIYLDGLTYKYPNWQEAYDVKKMATQADEYQQS
jgi:hypothetical protein